MISLLLVNFRSATHAATAVETARAATSEPLLVVAVDNSVDAAEAERLRAFCDVVVVSGENRGYAAGINAGRPHCQGDVVVITNPDVRFGTNAIDSLAAEVRAGATVAGPALYWDDAHSWLLPPGDTHSTREVLDRVLAGRSQVWREQRDRRRFRARVRFWSLRETTAVRTLSGAVLAVRLTDLDELRGFDERFRLYFEETDFLRRVFERRKRIVYVPAAKCRHLYNQSAAQVPEVAAQRYGESEMRYLEKWSGPFMARLLKRIERVPEPLSLEGEDQGEDIVTEASPSPVFETAAGHFGRARIPPGIAATLTGPFYVRHVERPTGRVLATYKILP